jgi:PadR family transcriptional regulator PadR
MSQLRKGVLELCVLSLVQTEQLYPADIAASMEKAGIPIPEGTLYTLLTRLKNANYLSYNWVESIEGPPRKYFMITREGQKYLESLIQNWQSITTSIKKIVK